MYILFVTRKGKLRRKYDESINAYNLSKKTDSIESGRRVAIEKELEATPEALATGNAVFDESGNFLIYGSLFGIKVLNLVTNKVVKTLGSSEPGERFLAVSLYQGVPRVDNQFLLTMAGAAGKQARTVEEMNSESVKIDPTIFCTSFKKRRFYSFSKREPDESVDARDILNEKPLEDETLVDPGFITYYIIFTF